MKYATRRLALAAAVLGAMVDASGRAEAGFLNDSLQGTNYYPTATAVYTGPYTGIVSPTTTFQFYGGVAPVTVGDTTITEGFTLSSNFTQAAFNGYVITDLTRNPGITGFTATSNISGFSSSLVTFTSNSVTVNQQGLAYTTSSFITISLQFGAAAVPEPASIAMLGLGMAGLGLLARRRRAC